MNRDFINKYGEKIRKAQEEAYNRQLRIWYISQWISIK